MERTLIAEVTSTDGEPFSLKALRDIVECFEEEGWTGVEIRRNPVNRDEWSVYADASSDPYAEYAAG